MYSRTRDEGFGPEVKRRIMLGTYVLSAGYYDAFYLKALQVRTLLRRDYERAFESVDVVAMPTSPTPPFRLGERSEEHTSELQSQSNLVCRLLLEKKKNKNTINSHTIYTIYHTH